MKNARLVEIRLDKLKTRPQEIVFCEPATEFHALAELAEQSGLEFIEPLRGQLLANWPGDVIKVSGQISTTVQMPCSRCLSDVSWELNLDVLVCYSPASTDNSDALDHERELSSDDLGLVPLIGDVIDIRSELEQEVIMAIPQHVLCMEDCAGLCPVCGVDLNQNKCKCERPIFHQGLAALKKVKIEK
ncbi:MAG: DUF177 domain-containing protein [Deltaproteobacteria bacterium]|jgi:uncharacterized protein|nr:DUF177 domain-containing protein [Deltaproteobacteria bacterium]